MIKEGKKEGRIIHVRRPPCSRPMKSWRRNRPKQTGADLEPHCDKIDCVDPAHLPHWRKTHALLISAHENLEITVVVD